MAGKRRRFARHTLHKVTVAADCVNVEIEQRKARPVVARGEPARGNRHADAVAGALTERPGCGLDAGGVAVFGMSRRDAVELAEILDVVEAHRRSLGDMLPVNAPYLRKVKERVEQQRGVARREHEAVAIDPQWVGWVVAQKILPQCIGDRGHTHRRSGVAGLGFLHGVDGERPDRVDA